MYLFKRCLAFCKKKLYCTARKTTRAIFLCVIQAEQYCTFVGGYDLTDVIGRFWQRRSLFVCVVHRNLVKQVFRTNICDNLNFKQR